VDKRKLKDLIEVAELQPIIDMAFDALGGATSIIDVEGTVLCASGWQDICTSFHRTHPLALQECIESDLQFMGHLSGGQQALVNRCPHGLIDCASPIVIDDCQLGNVFIGQVFIEPPDVQFFTRQARRFGFDEAAYLAALSKVPIVSEIQLDRRLPFVKALSVMVAELGLAHLKNLEREQQLRKAERIAGFGSWTLDNSSGTLAMSSQARHLLGMRSGRRPTLKTFLAKVHPDDRLRVAQALDSSIEQHAPGEVEHRVVETDNGEVRYVYERWEHMESRSGEVERSFGIIHDISHRVRRQAAVEQAAASERARLARDLHDSVSQSLFAASLMSESLQSVWRPEESTARELLDELASITRGTLSEVRLVLLEMLSPDSEEWPIEDSLAKLASSVRARSRISVTLQLDLDRPLPTEVQRTLYRIAREGMNNVARHSGAGTARLALASSGDRVRLEITDDGSGFDVDAVAPGHLGLVIVRERADSIGATIKVASKVGQGTRLTVEWGGAHGRRR